MRAQNFTKKIAENIKYPVSDDYLDAAPCPTDRPCHDYDDDSDHDSMELPDEDSDLPITEMNTDQEKRELIEIILTVMPDLERNYLEFATIDELKEMINLVRNEPRLDENLKKWFNEKWVRFGPDGKIRGSCARGSESEGKPKCLPQSQAHALGKKGRASAAARKRKKDPNPERQGPAINVATKKTNEQILEQGMTDTEIQQRIQPTFQATDTQLNDPNWMKSKGLVPIQDLETSVKAADTQNKALSSAQRSGFPTYQHQGQTYGVLNPKSGQGGATSQPRPLTPQQIQQTAGTNIVSGSGAPITAGSKMLTPGQRMGGVEETTLTGPYRPRQTAREKFKAELRDKGFDPDQAEKKLRELLARQAEERAELDRRYAQLDQQNISESVEDSYSEDFYNTIEQIMSKYAGRGGSDVSSIASGIIGFARRNPQYVEGKQQEIRTIKDYLGYDILVNPKDPDSVERARRTKEQARSPEGVKKVEGAIASILGFTKDAMVQVRSNPRYFGEIYKVWGDGNFTIAQGNPDAQLDPKQGIPSTVGDGFLAHYTNLKHLRPQGIKRFDDTNNTDGTISMKQGVAEGHADQQRKIFKKNGKPVGEVGIDRESSPGVGQWYMKCYLNGIDNAGYDSYQEAVAELKHCLRQGVAEGYILKKTNVDKYMEPGDPDEYTQDINIKDTDYEIINNKTGQVVGTASWTTNDFMGPGALKITMKNGATRYLDIWASEKGNPQTAFNRFVKDPKTAKKYKEQGVAEGSITEASKDFAERHYAGKEIDNLLRNLEREESPTVTPEIIKKMKELVAITGRGQEIPYFGSAGSQLDKLIDMYRQSQIQSGQMPQFTGRATTARDMARQIANQTRGTYRYFKPESWTTRSGQRYRDPEDYVVYPDQESYDDALEWIASKGKKVSYQDHFGLNTVTQIGRYIVEPSSFTQGAFSDEARTTHRISVRLAKTMDQGGRQQVDITDQQAGVLNAALRDIEATRSANAMTSVQNIIAVLRGMNDVKRVIANSKKILPRDKAKLDAIIAAAGKFQEPGNQGLAEGSEGTLWRVEQSESTGRFYVVKGYNKSRKVWKNKSGTGDFNDKKSAQAKADELNKGVAEIKQSCPECGGPAYEDRMLAEKQDACYHKVKSRYKVWPSAYASGALVQCRKKGAKNWGKKS